MVNHQIGELLPAEDKLGLDVVYVQAKRWSNSVGQPVVQAFAGSLEGVRARKGVLITTSSLGIPPALVRLDPGPPVARGGLPVAVKFATGQTTGELRLRGHFVGCDACGRIPILVLRQASCR